MTFILFFLIFFLSIGNYSFAGDLTIVPDDISFCIADVKFDGENLKILEFGDCAESMFSGYDELYGVGAVWIEFWKYLKRFNLPIWYVGKSHKFLALDSFRKLGGNIIPSISSLRTKIQKQFQLEKLDINQAGIVFLKKQIQLASTLAIKRKFPSLVFINQLSRQHVISKYRTDLLFKSSGSVKNFRPRCLICPRKYSPDLAQSIIKKIDVPVYVIKPLGASCGRGVIFVEKDNLDQMLYTIFKNRPVLRKLARENNHTFGFWISTTSHNILIEEYVPSKPTIVGGKPYDATMRLVFAMSLINGATSVDVLAAYWKLPAKSLIDKGSLNEKHRSDVKSSASVCSVKVSDSDFQRASILIKYVMQHTYVKMLKRFFRGNEDLLELLSS